VPAVKWSLRPLLTLFTREHRRKRRLPPRQTNLPRILRRFYYALGVLAATIVLGTVGFRFGAHPAPPWEDALFMTLISVSTVGYGEVVPLNSLSERVIASVVAIVGFGVLTFLFTSLSVFFLESDLDITLRRNRMEKQISKLKQHYIICGFGRVGRNVAHELIATKRPFVAIDPNETFMHAQLEQTPGLLYLCGDASDDDLLLAADLEDAAGVFAVTGDDSKNLMIALTAKQLNPNVRVVARCHEVRNIPKLKKAGADAIVSPDFTGGMRIASAMVRPQVVSFLDEMLRTDLNLRVEEVPVPAGRAPLALGAVRGRSNDFVVVAVRAQDKWAFNPADDWQLLPGHVVIVMASPQGRAALEAALAA
jgi:voltage-gated potassium channel